MKPEIIEAFERVRIAQEETSRAIDTLGALLEAEGKERTEAQMPDFGIKDHRLLAVPFKQAADHGGALTPEAIVMHYTAGANREGDTQALTARDDRYVSAHILIDRDGSISQFVPFNVRAYHAGASEWKGRKELNAWSIGIELSNWGPLVKRGGVFYTWPQNFGRALPVGLGVFEGRHKHPACQYQAWEAFPPPQIAAAIRVCKALMGAYGIALVLGHDDVSPGRKIDPGPAFPMEQFRSAIGAPQP